MTHNSKAKNYKTSNKSRGGNHKLHSSKDESFIVWNFNATVVALDEAIASYKRYNEEGMNLRILTHQLEAIERLLITCLIILNGVKSYEFLTSMHERVIREALSILA